ncbi:MAG TPA: S8 family peptidase [Candidatus Hydrogenedentes bacterium]|nr:S8 family peptidase [Candidatus Hydrogenedentota bacterium]
MRQVGSGEHIRTLATVFVPHEKRNYFLKKLQSYGLPPEPGKKPKNDTLARSILDIRRAVLESFWREDERGLIPDDIPEWVEVWLASDSVKTIKRFQELLNRLDVSFGESALKFPERAVMLIMANRPILETLIEQSDDIVEYRLAKRLASFYIELENRDQTDLVQEILARTYFDDADDIAICILDSGVNNGHALLHPVLDSSDMHTFNPQWGTHDHHGHGTLMAGTAVYGDLLKVLNSNHELHVLHRLESSKILPPPPAQNQKALWGHITGQGVSRAEIQAPKRKRVICMAVTSDENRDRGRPSSWSAELDAMASGYNDDTKRLIVVSAGNVDDSNCWRNYPTENITNEIHDPGQSWNVLTVGAFTEKTRITDDTLLGYAAIAPDGGLSPYSTTSSTWHGRRWPIKPEVVFEGGNVARGPNNSISVPDDLKLVSTYYNPQRSQFAPFCATSAAAAQAAWMAAQIQIAYPEGWPETVRALIVHSADWTDTMRQQFLQATPATKQQIAYLMRICGYGVPNLSHALHTLSNSLTLISQTTLQPYDKKKDRYVTNEMHLYELPWPKEALEFLGEALVTMRITLSYFIEPAPGEVGWNNRYRYASHALRFDVNGAQETEMDFIQRVNQQAREDGEHPGTQGPTDKWLIGDARNVGSIHSDIWHGTAIELSTSNLVAVYPTIGWWRERHHLDRWDRSCRYSLIVSIQTPEEKVDIYTPVAVKVGIAIPIPINH